jgi:hypothetical protein
MPLIRKKLLNEEERDDPVALKWAVCELITRALDDPS